MNKLITAVATLGILLSSPTLAAEETQKLYEDAGSGWIVTTNGKDCYASRFYEKGDALIVSYVPDDDTTYLSLTIEAASSLKEGAKIPLYIYFMSGNNLDEGWGKSEFNAVSNNQLIGMFDGRDMLKDLSVKSVVAFSLDDKADRIIGSYRLDGSAKAMNSLRKCAFIKRGLNPDDPFLR